MSFIDCKEKVFCIKNELPRTQPGKKKSINTMSFITPSTDPRSWSLDLCSQRDYILRAFYENTSVKNSVSECSTGGSSSSSSKPASSNRVNKTKRYLRGFKKKIKSTQDSKEDCISSFKTIKNLNNVDKRIKQLINEKEEAEKRAQMAKDEVENLRNLVKDVQEELSLAQRLKSENLKLRSEVDVGYKNQLLEAQDEINYLSAQLDIYKNYQSQYNSLKESYHKLKEEYDSVNLNLVKYSTDNNELKRKIDEYKGNNCREIYASNAIVDRDVLRERIQCRDEKINFLVSFLEEQELTINDLAIQLERLTSNVSTKEGLISKHMNSLKSNLNDKNARIMYLEEKLYASELLIRELENMREQLRLANAMLSENLRNYKTQFNSVVSCSERLLVHKTLCEREITEKDAQIKKLSIFPQSPKTAVYLSQILHILKKSEESASDETDTIFSYVPSIRRIIEEMKSEVWNQESIDLIRQLDSTVTQTEYTVRDSFSQHEIYFYCSHKCVEANIPDKFYFENQNLRNDLSEMNSSIALLEEAYFTKNSLNKELEKKLITTVDEKKSKEKEIIELQKGLELTQEKLLTLQGELEYNDSLLNRALNEIEIEQSVRESTSDLLSASLDSALYEYSKYVEVLEVYITEKEEQIEYLQNCVNHEIQSREKFNEEHILKLETEIKRLTEINVKEKQNVEESNLKIHSLKKQLSDKKNKFKVIQEKLEKAERLFEQINKIDSPFMANVDSDMTDGAEMDQIALITTNKILLYGESLENHWKNEKSLKEKLLKETYTQSYVENIYKINNVTSKKLKMKIKELSQYIMKLKKVLNKNRIDLKESNKEINNYKFRIDELKINYEKLLKEKEQTYSELNDKGKEVEKVTSMLEAKNNDYEALKQEKEKMQKVLYKIIGNLEHSLSGCNKESIGTITESQKTEESQIKNLTSKNNELSAVINELQGRLDSLLYVPQKEQSTSVIDLSSVSVQTNNDWEKQKQEELELYYKGIIKGLQENFDREKELLEQENTNELEAFKSDLKLIMKRLQKNVAKMQEEHALEISNLKSFHEKDLKTLISNHNIEEMNKNIELERQKKHYENVLEHKDEELNNGLNELRTEIKNIISKKEEAMSKIKEVTKIHVNYMKKKYKKTINKVKNELKNMTKKYEELKNSTIKAEIEKSDDDSQTDHINFKILEFKQYDQHSQTSLDFRTNDRFVECLITEPKTNMESQTKVAKLRDEGANTDGDFKHDQGKQYIPEKMDHIVFGLPPNKNIDINFKESIKCSIKETQSTYIGDLFRGMSPYNGSGDAPIRDLFYQRDKNELITHIDRLENELLQKTEDFNRNVLMYQETIRRQRSKIKELENSLNQETLQTCHLQHRLGMEFTRAEQLQVERNELREYCEALQKYIQDHEIESHSEREKYNYLKKRFDSIIYQRKQTDQLEESLKRLKEKLETAVEYEKRLTEDIQDDKKANERFQDIIKCNDMEEGSKYIQGEKETLASSYVQDHNITNNNKEEKRTIRAINKSDLKVVFIQQCEFRRMWSQQILEKKYHNFKENVV